MNSLLLASVSNIKYEPPKIPVSTPFPITTVLSFICMVCFGVFIFLLMREVLCWYWKINEIKKLLEDIRDNTSQNNLNKKSTTENTNQVVENASTNKEIKKVSETS